MKNAYSKIEFALVRLLCAIKLVNEAGELGGNAATQLSLVGNVYLQLVYPYLQLGGTPAFIFIMALSVNVSRTTTSSFLFSFSLHTPSIQFTSQFSFKRGRERLFIFLSVYAKGADVCPKKQKYANFGSINHF